MDLRDKKHLAYALSGFNVLGIDAGAFGFYMGTRQSNVNKGINGLIDFAYQVKKRGITREEMTRAKRYLLGSFDIELSSNSNMATQIALSETYGLGYLAHRDYGKNLKKVSLSKIHETAKKYLDLDRRVLSVVSSK